MEEVLWTTLVSLLLYEVIIFDLEKITLENLLFFLTKISHEISLSNSIYIEIKIG